MLSKIKNLYTPLLGASKGAEQYSFTFLTYNLLCSAIVYLLLVAITSIKDGFSSLTDVFYLLGVGVGFLFKVLTLAYFLHRVVERNQKELSMHKAFEYLLPASIPLTLLPLASYANAYQQYAELALYTWGLLVLAKLLKQQLQFESRQAFFIIIYISMAYFIFVMTFQGLLA